MMSQKTIKNLLIFLVVNVVITLYIIGSYLYKSFEEKKPTQVVKKENPVVAKVIPTVAPLAVNENVDNTLTSNNEIAAIPANSAYKFPMQQNVPVVEPKIVQKVDLSKVCVEMGPFNAEEKSTMDFILAKNKQTELASIEKMQSHQLFWNLGKNKSEADKLFGKQKEGAMSDAKFVLAQNQDKDWIVHITKVHGSAEVAKKLLKDLEEKAQKINAGGTWQYTTLPEGYFYKFNDFKSLKEVTVNSIDIMLKAAKDPC